jgi:hypothetical protein
MVESRCCVPACLFATIALMQPMHSVSLMSEAFISQALIGSLVRWAGFAFWAMSSACTKASEMLSSWGAEA